MSVDTKELGAVLFHRKKGFYPLDLPLDDDLAVHAERNPGTLKITDIFGRVFWQAEAGE